MFEIPTKSFKELLTFPTVITFRVIIKAQDEIAEVKELIESIAKENITYVDSKPSKNWTYNSYRLTVKINDDKILNEIYQKVGKNHKVLHIL